MKQKNKMQNRCGLLLFVLKERKEYICYLYLYLHIFYTYIYMHVVYICAYIILYHFWKDTDDTGVIGGLRGGKVYGCGTELEGRFFTTKYFIL